MPEPTSTAVSGITLAAGTLTLTGSLFGVQYEALLAGFFGGLLYISYVPQDTKTKIAISLFAASLIAGYFAPIVTLAAIHYLPWTEALGRGQVQIAVAAALGLGGQSTVPAVLIKTLKYLSKR